MPRWFNVGGPNRIEDNYTLPAMRRLPDVAELIDERLYFVLHAPRQVGKTTALMTLAQELTEAGRYAAVLVSMERGAGLPRNLGGAELAILDSWQSRARAFLPVELRPPVWPEAPEGARIGMALSAWAEAIPRPLVIFLDEIDALEGENLISILRQLREGYGTRPAHFPASLALIGMRDVRDYKLASGGTDRSHSASPFNIMSKSLTMRNFTRDEVAELYAQHTAETGQMFEPDAVTRAFEVTQGQPWLINALARHITKDLVRDRNVIVTLDHVNQAKRMLIEEQATHIDSLFERIREPRVQRIVEPIMAGRSPGELPTDDIQFVLDLGLLRLNSLGGLEVANPIYREVLARGLAEITRASFPVIQPTWRLPNGRIDWNALRDEFLAFWKQHGEPLMRAAPYHEIAPHLVLMAFLHRVVNGKGNIDREYAIGMGRMDLCVRHGEDALAIEIKVWRDDGDPDPVEEGLVQLDGYLERLGHTTGWLVIFDRRPSAPKLPLRTGLSEGLSPSGRKVQVLRG